VHGASIEMIGWFEYEEKSVNSRRTRIRKIYIDLEVGIRDSRFVGNISTVACD
jgi:hypothetical protein